MVTRTNCRIFSLRGNSHCGQNHPIHKESGGDLYRHTRHHLKYRHKPLASPSKGKWGRRKSIDERPDCIDRKERFGDFEMDLIIGAHQREAILTLTERKTGYAIIEKLPNGKNAKALDRVDNRSLVYFKRMGLLHSITMDNRSEFMAFRSMERVLRVPVFFAKPYCSTDKPHVELLNKFIRQYIPKGTSFKDIDDKQIRNIRRLLNNRPRKSLDFKSPNEVLALLLSYRCTWDWDLQFLALLVIAFFLPSINTVKKVWALHYNKLLVFFLLSLSNGKHLWDSYVLFLNTTYSAEQKRQLRET